MTTKIECPECGESITVNYSVEPGEPRTWMYPGSDPEFIVEGVLDSCDCSEKPDIYGIFDVLIEKMSDDAESARDARADYLREALYDN